MTVYRVQHWLDGRGPFRPGFSKTWADRSFTPGMKALPSFLEEFGRDVLAKIPAGYHAGCGCRTEDAIHKWFSKAELDRLNALGFKIVALEGCEIIAESENQILFSRRTPLNQ